MLNPGVKSGHGRRGSSARLRDGLLVRAPGAGPMDGAAGKALLRVLLASLLGTAVCKKLEWKVDELSLYKIVLLNF